MGEPRTKILSWDAILVLGSRGQDCRYGFSCFGHGWIKTRRNGVYVLAVDGSKAGRYGVHVLAVDGFKTRRYADLYLALPIPIFCMFSTT